MITPENISNMKPGDQIEEGFITVRREREDTAKGKPRFVVNCYREAPLCAGTMGAFSAKQALANVRFYVRNLAGHSGQYSRYRRVK